MKASEFEPFSRYRLRVSPSWLHSLHPPRTCTQKTSDVGQGDIVTYSEGGGELPVSMSGKVGGAVLAMGEGVRRPVGFGEGGLVGIGVGPLVGVREGDPVCFVIGSAVGGFVGRNVACPTGVRVDDGFGAKVGDVGTPLPMGL